MRLNLVKILMIVITFTLIGCSEEIEEFGDEMEEERYINPTSLVDEWEEYGIGDPFVLKHNGVYYLYSSTRDTDTGVKMWSSTNLVSWDYEGIVADMPETKAAYAPEVIYWNGYFYMYTSPAGHGHYVLQSESPTGPFELATSNIGKSIDGNVFIDDDGSMFFSHSSHLGIQVAPMESPLRIRRSTTTAASMRGWTEGPTLFKRHGKYYMTYTGNHVFSRAYRIDYAVAEDPIDIMNGYVRSSSNPILINTEGPNPNVGLGHNSIIRGPDLDTDFIVYHNLEGPGIIGPLRHMNMERIAWNGEELHVLGPTYTEQQGPALPAFNDRFQRSGVGPNWDSVKGRWEITDQFFLRQRSSSSRNQPLILAGEQTNSIYTAEFHGKMLEESDIEDDSRYGVVFSYQDQDNYGMALLNPMDNTFETRFIIDGVESEWESSELPEELDHTKLHQIRVEKTIDSYRFYVDEMHQHTREADLSGGQIGYMTKNARADFGYIAFSDYVDGSGIFDVYKPLPGTIQAVHYQSDQSVEADQSVYRLDEMVDVRQGSEKYYYIQLQESDQVTYNVNMTESGDYNLDLEILAESDEVTFKFLLNNEPVAEEFVVSNLDSTNEWQTISLGPLDLPQGEHELSVELVQGEIGIKAFTFYEHAQVEEWVDNFEQELGPEWTMYEAAWEISEESAGPIDPGFSKIISGEIGWSDYVIETQVQLTEEAGEAGIIARGVNPADGRTLDQNNNNMIQGYYAFITSNGVTLRKQNYGYEDIEHVELELDLAESHHIKVEVDGTKISVFVNDMDTPQIEVDERFNTPFTHGRAGLASSNNIAKFSQFKVSPK